MTKMSKIQRATFNQVENYVKHGYREVKDVRIEVEDFDGSVYIQLEVGMPDDEGTMAEALCRSCYSFCIGKQGGLFFYDSKRNYRKHYIKYYEVPDIYHR